MHVYGIKQITNELKYYAMRGFRAISKISVTIIFMSIIFVFLKITRTFNGIRRADSQDSTLDDEIHRDNVLHQPVRDDTILGNTIPDGAIRDKFQIGDEPNSKTLTASKFSKDLFTDPAKWTVLLTVNNAYYDMFENWWWYFKKLNIIVNVTVIAEDDIVFEKLMQTYTMPSVVIARSWILNDSSARMHNTRGYKKMVSVRPAYIIKYLEESMNVLYADIDTLFLKNPFKYLKGNFDMWTQSENKATIICSGFMAIRSKENTVNVMKQWYSKLNESLQRNQPALNDILRKSNLKINRLSEILFVGGPQYSAMSQEQRSNVVVVHATYCLGHEQKYQCFKKWKLWG